MRYAGLLARASAQIECHQRTTLWGACRSVQHVRATLDKRIIHDRQSEVCEKHSVWQKMPLPEIFHSRGYKECARRDCPHEPVSRQFKAPRDKCREAIIVRPRI